MKQLLFVLLLCSIGTIGYSQSSSPSGGKILGNGLLFPYYKLDEFAGKKFVILPKNGEKRPYHLKSETMSYEKYAGKVVTITKIDRSKGIKEIYFHMDSSGEDFVHQLWIGEEIEEIGLLDDIDSARNRWLGKTFWYKKLKYMTMVNDQPTYVQDRHKISQVKIVRVQPGDLTVAPVRIVFEYPDGIQGHADVNVSGTNMSPSINSRNHWDESFGDQDPHSSFHWDQKTWDAIEQDKLLEGMTAEQVTFCRGIPNDVIRTGEFQSWDYGDGHFLHFHNGLLTFTY